MKQVAESACYHLHAGLLLGTLKMEVTGSSETLVDFQSTTWHIPEGTLYKILLLILDRQQEPVFTKPLIKNVSRTKF
jgi:hypothetical protein